MVTKVVHCHKENYDIYIGRAAPRLKLKASKWGNPFPMKNKSDEERARVIEEYKVWFWTQPDLINSIPELKDKVRGCWCKPYACHGDFLAELANKAEEIPMKQVKRERNVENTCAQCGATFYSSKAARTCSKKCRVALSRRLKVEAGYNWSN